MAPRVAASERASEETELRNQKVSICTIVPVKQVRFVLVSRLASDQTYACQQVVEHVSS